MSTLPKKHYSPEEYLELESVAQERHEYYRGEIFLMPGATERHYRIVAKLQGELYVALRERPCEPFSVDVAIKICATGLYTYPDGIVACPPMEFQRGPIDVLLNPTILFEVLSPSTENYDRGTKAKHYRQIPSVMEILLVSQSEPLIEHYIRTGDDEWSLSNCSGLGSTLKLPSIQCAIPLAAIYAGVEWPETPEQT